MKQRKFKKRSGMTLVEVVVASSMSAITLLFAISVFLMCTSAWARGENRIDGESNVRQAVRIVSDELREAMWVKVDANGLGLSYRKPAKEVSGEFKIPVVWDGKDRRIELQGNSIVLEEDSSTKRIICRNVMTVDPFRASTHAMNSAISQQASSGTWQAYKVFEPNVGTFATEVTVTVVTSNKGGRVGEYVRARKREVVALRNVPELIK